MKLTESRLQSIILEELSKLNEGVDIEHYLIAISKYLSEDYHLKVRDVNINSMEVYLNMGDGIERKYSVELLEKSGGVLVSLSREVNGRIVFNKTQTWMSPRGKASEMSEWVYSTIQKNN